MHIEKYNRNAVGHLIEHYLRDEKIYKTQKHINPDLSGQNYMLGNSELYGMEKYKQIINTPGLKIHKRQDVITLVDVIVSLPKPEYFPQEREREFFEISHKFLTDIFGKSCEEFVVSSVVHKDEENSQPHLHYSFCPIITDEKGNLKMCAKTVITRKMLRSLHKEADKVFYDYFGFDVGIINGATKEGNLTIPQLKEQTKKYNKLVETNKKLEKENEQLKMELAENMHNLKIWQEEIGITPNFELAK